jgi:hypothetical protein
MARAQDINVAAQALAGQGLRRDQIETMLDKGEIKVETFCPERDG